MSAVIFDCDGVLADTERDGHRVAFNRMFANEGIDFSWSSDDYADALQIAGGKERIRALLTAEFIAAYNLPSDETEIERLVAAWHAAKTEQFVSLVEAGELPARPGIRRLAAEAIASGWQLAVASTSAARSVRAVLTTAVGTDLAGQFVVCAGDDVSQKKPAPDVYRLALSRLNLTNGEAIAVEDSAIGVTSARTAGLPVVVTTSAYTADEDFSSAAIVVDTLGEPTGPPLNVRKSVSSIPIGRCLTLAHFNDAMNAAAANT